MYSTVAQVANTATPWLETSAVIFAGSILCIFACVLYSLIFDTDELHPSFLSFLVAVLVFAATVTYNNSESNQPIYKNEPITATFIGYQPEINNSGKSTTHTLYAIFEVPEGKVILPVSPGTPIPPKSILYRN